MKETIKNLREYYDFSQTQIASRIGVSRQMYIRYENGETEPNLKTISALCRIYKVPYHVIIDNEYSKGLPEQRESETESWETSSGFFHDLSGVSASESAPSYGFEGSRAVKANVALSEIVTLIRQLNLSERLQLISFLADSTRMDQERVVLKKSGACAKMKGLTKEEAFALFEKYAGCIDSDSVDYREELLSYYDERYGE